MDASLRAALALKLERAAADLDGASSSRLPATVGTTRNLLPIETKALKSAGDAIWEASRRGLLRSPGIARVVGERAAGGVTRPRSGDYGYSIQMFYDLMSKYFLPMGEVSFPRFTSVRRETPAKEQVKWERHQIDHQAMACRIIARTIARDDFARWYDADDHTRAIKRLGRNAAAFGKHVRDTGTTGSNAEIGIFTAFYVLRCYYKKAVPEQLQKLWRRFKLGTKPYEEDARIALSAAAGMARWARSELGTASLGGDGAKTTLSTGRPSKSKEHALLRTRFANGEWKTPTEMATALGMTASNARKILKPRKKQGGKKPRRNAQ